MNKLNRMILSWFILFLVDSMTKHTLIESGHVKHWSQQLAQTAHTSFLVARIATSHHEWEPSRSTINRHILSDPIISGCFLLDSRFTSPWLISIASFCRTLTVTPDFRPLGDWGIDQPKYHAIQELLLNLSEVLDSCEQHCDGSLANLLLSEVASINRSVPIESFAQLCIPKGCIFLGMSCRIPLALLSRQPQPPRFTIWTRLSHSPRKMMKFGRAPIIHLRCPLEAGSPRATILLPHTMPNFPHAAGPTVRPPSRRAKRSLVDIAANQRLAALKRPIHSSASSVSGRIHVYFWPGRTPSLPFSWKRFGNALLYNHIEFSSDCLTLQQ